MWKRFQYYGSNGIVWTKWFKLLNTDDMPKYQYGTANSKFKLLNEYSNNPQNN